MENNKTAVEWLFHQLWEEPKDKFTWYAILEKAKEMEKQQIIHAYNEDLYGGLSGKRKFDDGEQYYNEEYGTKLD